jgi:hypothetical protein
VAWLGAALCVLFSVVVVLLLMSLTVVLVMLSQLVLFMFALMVASTRI